MLYAKFYNGIMSDNKRLNIRTKDRLIIAGIYMMTAGKCTMIAGIYML